MKISEDKKVSRTFNFRVRIKKNNRVRIFNWKGMGDESDEKILTWLKGVFYVEPEVVTLQADDILNLLPLPCHLEQFPSSNRPPKIQ